MDGLKTGLLIILGMIALGIAGFFGVQSVNNKAITLEEAVETTKSDIQVQEKKRIDLVYNLADCVKQYDMHEAEVLQNLASSRSQSGNVESISTSIYAVAEAYPELKSSEQYKTLMLELTTLENEISQYRTAYNKAVERYNRYTRKFLSKLFLGWLGYERIEYARLDYNAPSDAPQNLFGEK